MKFFSMIFLMAFLFLAVTFSMQNTGPVILRYYNLLDFQTPVYLLVFIVFFTGVVFSGLAGLIERFKLSRNISRLKKEIKDLEAELFEVRKVQLTDQNTAPIRNEYLS
ncbi:MAG: LapA family protein [Syntrophales bacterium]|nr:LapA family protein [Syntrophales bacterium]MDD5232488.1 LapA family protein [Syntrophales bacterium]MDD5531595.1 LapA family protein [Syntrophales bacterium]